MNNTNKITQALNKIDDILKLVFKIIGEIIVCGLETFLNKDCVRFVEINPPVQSLNKFAGMFERLVRLETKSHHTLGCD